MTLAQLGVCYYPEHWPTERWAEDASAMVAHGIEIVRIGEFAWSRLEPTSGNWHWEWLDQAVETLAAAGLYIVMGTPTACPPNWLVRTHPEILPVGPDGQPRGFGSRRHYSFSSEVYREHSRRVTKAMAERYGHHPAIVGWQLDNEYGCHDTTVCYSDASLQAFHHWLQLRYKTVDALNQAWGNVFWSQEYANFRDVGLPVAVTETNPAHRMAFRRFSSDQVRAFSDEQAHILRQYSKPNIWLTHNFMGNFVDFDHYPVMEALDVASWDSYPLGFLDQGWFSDSIKSRYRRTGHPDWAAFHHDLYRGVGNGRFGVMEQQPGSVNWAANNAEPLPGMVQLWSMEAIAHGAEFVSWFRWRQAPFAQEQMHAGLLRPDAKPARASEEAILLHGDLQQLPETSTRQASVALLFDYEACWLTDIQPHRAGYDALQVAFEFYSAARALGLSIDILPTNASLDGYQLLILPCIPFTDSSLVKRIAASTAHVLIGPRAGSKDVDVTIPENLAPGPFQSLIDLTVVSVDGIRPGERISLKHDNDQFAYRWIEHVDTALPAQWETTDGRSILFGNDRISYLAASVDEQALRELIAAQCVGAGIPTSPVPDDLRVRERGDLLFVFNYGSTAQRSPIPGTPLRGEALIPPASYAVYRKHP
ncbi:MAG: beta-galactosidase [Pseudomonadota bacterium]